MSGHFVGQHIDEEILVVTRPHWIAFLGVIIEAAALVLLLPVTWALTRWTMPMLLEAPYGRFMTLLDVIYGFFVWSLFFQSWLHYWLDVWIVTTERIIKIEQHSLFRRDISEFRISRVQDVTVEIRGVLATMLKFGDLKVLTASEGAGFVFSRIPHPEHVKDIILQHQSRNDAGAKKEQEGLRS